MSSAAAPAAEAPAKKGPKKLIIIIAAAVILLSLLGGGALFYMKKKAAAAAAEADGGDATEETQAETKKEHAKGEHKAPTFVPLEPFTVNLADKDQDKYLQVGLTLEVGDPHLAEELKGYMPAIRNAVLLILSHKTSDDLLEVEGKEKMAEEIRVAAARAMGLDVEDESASQDEATDGHAPKKKKKKKKTDENPIAHVHYSNFIIQ
jgi:flagellar FliL protein